MKWYRPIEFLRTRPGFILRTWIGSLTVSPERFSISTPFFMLQTGERHDLSGIPFGTHAQIMLPTRKPYVGAHYWKKRVVWQYRSNLRGNV